MRAIVSASSGLAALDCTTYPPPASCPDPSTTEHPRALPPHSLPFRAARAQHLLGQVYHHGQRGAAPVLQTPWAALVLVDQEPLRQLIFVRVSSLASLPTKTLPSYANLRVTVEVLHPVRAVASSREHIECTRLRHEGEPDLDLMRCARYPPCRRQVAKVLVRQGTEINHHRLQVTGIRRASDTASAQVSTPP